MPKIYDNIENHLTTGLNDTLPLGTPAESNTAWAKSLREEIVQVRND